MFSRVKKTVFLFLVATTLLQGCAPDAELLQTGRSFDSTDTYALVVFGVKGEYLPDASRNGSLSFARFDPSTGQFTGSCWTGTSRLTIQAPPENTDGMSYLAFRTPPGVYVTTPYLTGSSTKVQVTNENTSSRNRDRGILGFAVTSGGAYYIGDLIFKNRDLVETEPGFDLARDWAEESLEIAGSLLRSTFLQYYGPIFHRLCTI